MKITMIIIIIMQLSIVYIKNYNLDPKVPKLDLKMLEVCYLSIFSGIGKIEVLVQKR
jgi:hypothetical protein